MTKNHNDPEFIETYLPVTLAWVAVAVVTLTTAWNVYFHLVHYSRPDLQQHVLRIILVGPIYVLSAAVGLGASEDVSFFVRAVRDIWEAVVIYSFLNLIIEYMGGEHLCLQNMCQRETSVPHLFPFNYCFKPIPIGQMIRLPKIGALQFVILKPVVATISLIAYACGQYEDWYYQWLLFIVYNVSYSVALYALYLIYWASHDHPSLQSKRPLLKFISVKMIVFLTFWQALLLPHAPLPGQTRRWEDFILAIEMVIFGCLMNVAFTWREFQSGLLDAKDLHLDSDPIQLDVATFGQPSATGQPSPTESPPAASVSSGGKSVSSAGSAGRGGVVHNAAAAFCPRDIMADASRNFSRRYQQHVLIESAQEYELHDSEVGSQKAAVDAPVAGKGHRTFHTKTYLIGQSLVGSTPGATTCGRSRSSSHRISAQSEAAIARNVAAVLDEEDGSPAMSDVTPTELFGAASAMEQGHTPLEFAPPLHHGFGPSPTTTEPVYHGGPLQGGF